MAIVENEANFLADFGETFTHSTGDFTALWKDAHYGGQDEYGIVSVSPIIVVFQSKADDFSVGDAITRESTSIDYSIAELMPNGVGLVAIRLHKTTA